MFNCHREEKKQREYAKTQRESRILQKLRFTSFEDDGQNNVQTRFANVIGIFTENFSCLSSIAAEKNTFTSQRYGLTDRQSELMSSFTTKSVNQLKR